MSTWIGKTLPLIAGVGALIASSSAAFAQSGPPGWTSIAPAQTLAPTDQEMFPGPSDSPPATLFFGAALAVDHSVALIGMPGYPDGDDSTAANEGAVAIFLESAGSWVREGTLRAADQAAGEFFGERVALNGDIAAVEAESGIYVFRRASAGWSETQKLVPPAGMRFDGGLAIGNAAIFVGAPGDGAPGAVFLFEPDLNGSWHPIQTLASGEQSGSDDFGAEIAAADGTVVIGADGDDGGRGAAFVFTRRGTGWRVQQKLTAPDESTSAAFGAAVAVSGKRIVVGAPEADADPSGQCGATAAGAVYVFAVRGSAWRQQTKIATPAAGCTGSFSTGLFGTEVSASADHVVAATPSLFPNQIGAAYDFASDGAAEIPAADAPDPSLVSTPILALSDDVLFIGLPYDQGFSTGITEVFELGGTSPGVGASRNGASENSTRRAVLRLRAAPGLCRAPRICSS